MTLSVRHLTYRLSHRPLIEDISMDFQPGVLYGILGPNGAGKSTLLKTISRIWAPTSGAASLERKRSAGALSETGVESHPFACPSESSALL